jgi:hypothetical protein
MTQITAADITGYADIILFEFSDTGGTDEGARLAALRSAERITGAVLARAAEGIAAEIERVIGGYPGNEVERPKVETGRHLNDAQWAAKIAREWNGQEG